METALPVILMLLQVVLLGVVIPGVRWLYMIRRNDLAHLHESILSFTNHLATIDQRLSRIEGRLEGI